MKNYFGTIRINPVIAIIIVLVLLLFVRIILAIPDFAKELKYLNIEISRTTGQRRKKYIRQKRRLWLSFLFFLGR